MKRMAGAFFVLGTALALAMPAYSQSTCANWMAIGFRCYGANNCSQPVSVLRPTFGSGFCLEETFVQCCDQQILDYTVGPPCSFSCDSALMNLLKDPKVVQFARTHTLWMKDCSGHYGPFGRTWDAPEKPINLSPRALSGIGE